MSQTEILLPLRNAKHSQTISNQSISSLLVCSRQPEPMTIQAAKNLFAARSVAVSYCLRQGGSETFSSEHSQKRYISTQEYIIKQEYNKQVFQKTAQKSASLPNTVQRASETLAFYCNRRKSTELMLPIPLP
jgi:putative hemolysin